MRAFLFAAALLAASYTAAADRLPEASAAAIRAHVAFLSDDLLEGRAAGTRGYDIAARYVATQMELLGLKPAGTGGGWLQPLSMIQATRVIPAATAIITRGEESVGLESGKDFIPGASYFGSQSEVSGPMVFVGFGIHAPARQHDDFAGVDLAGKVAVVLSDSPESLPSSERAYYSRVRTREIASRGAIGIVYIQTPEREKRSPWEKSLRQAALPGMRLLDADGQPVEAYPEIRASISVSAAAAPLLFAGAPRSMEQIWSDSDAGRPGSFELPASITISTRTELAQAESANVVGLLEGSDPVLKNEYVVFSSHLDHLGIGPAVNGDAIYNGELDNASGVAVMLEAARVLALSRPRLKRSILFIAVTAEEKGLLGSKYYAMNPTVPKDALVANINMDMPVLLYETAGFTAFGAEHSTLGEVARRASEAEGLILVPDKTPDEVLFVRSDQYSFVEEGVPSIYLDDAKVAADPAIDAEEIFREHLKRDYHAPSDDMRLPIHWESFARLARVNARIGREIANARGRPEWLPGDFFGETFGRKPR
jgi:Zn-dependent M28 family amino/carboxypeptidase